MKKAFELVFRSIRVLMFPIVKLMSVPKCMMIKTHQVVLWMKSAYLTRSKSPLISIEIKLESGSGIGIFDKMVQCFSPTSCCTWSKMFWLKRSKWFSNMISVSKAELDWHHFFSNCLMAFHHECLLEIAINFKIMSSWLDAQIIQVCFTDTHLISINLTNAFSHSKWKKGKRHSR